MGSAMAANLMRAGYRVIGYDVAASGAVATTAGQADWWRERAAKWAGGRTSSSARCRHRTPCCRLRRRWPPRPAAAIVVETSTLPIAVKEQARRALARARRDCSSIVR